MALIRWKSGFVAYWVRGLYYTGIGAAAASAAVWAADRWIAPYDLIRHPVSIVGVVCFLLNLPFALRRRRKWIRFGHQAKWLKAHWFFAGAGFALVVIHTALSPATFGGWAALALASFAMLTGFVVHFTKRWVRYYALRVHLVSVVVLVVAFAAHGIHKMRHPWFPLDAKTPRGEVVHDVACAVCHEYRNRYNEHACIGCHVHSTEEIIFAHESHGVYNFAPCLDCHAATVNGVEYYTGSGSPPYGNVFDFYEDIREHLEAPRRSP